MKTQPLSLRETYFGKHVLLTGASGFVGKVWLAMMLAKFPELEKVYVLVRPKKKLSGFERFEALLGSSPVFRPLHEQWGAELPEYLRDRLEILEGDVSEPGLGIAESVAKRVRKKIDLLVHCAGLVNFEPDLRDAIKINVTGTMHALEFAQSCDHAGFLHISTCFVCGKTADRLAPETLTPNYVPDRQGYDAEAEYREVLDLTRNTQEKRDWEKVGHDRARKRGWPNAYTYSKSLAESLIQARAGGLRYSVFRPSIVESAMDFPFPGWGEGAETCTPISYLAGSWLRHITARPNLTLDIIPVDAVARGMVAAGAALLAGRHQPVYQCASSQKNRISVGRMLELITLAHRAYYRDHGETTLQRLVLSRWDSVTVSEQSPFLVSKLKDRATTLLHWVRKLEAKLSEPGQRWVHPVTAFATRSKWTLVKAEKIIQVFLPFIYENDFRFVTQNLSELEIAEEDFRFHPETIDWREYVLKVHEPGIRKWCYPILEGKPVERYVPEYPFRLPRQANGEAKRA